MEALRLAMDTVEDLRKKGIMDAIEILPHDAERYDVVRVRG